MPPNDKSAGQKAIDVYLAAVNDAGDAKSDAAVKGTWQQSCIWCATVIQPVQMAEFAKGWRLTPARVSDPRVTYWKTGISGQLLYRVTMSVSAMNSSTAVAPPATSIQDVTVVESDAVNIAPDAE